MKDLADIKGLWAVGWRCMVFLPWMLFVFLALLAVLMSLVTLLLLVVMYIYIKSWTEATIAGSVWVAVVWVWRRYRLWDYFEEPPSLL